MNAERLHAIAEELKAEVKETNYPALLDQLVAGLREAGEKPSQPGPQEKISNARDELNSSLQDARSNDFSPAWREQLHEMGVDDLLGEALLEELERILSTNEITPVSAASEIEQIQERVQRFVSALDQASSALDFFGIGREKLSPGEFEIGFLVPRKEVDGGLEELGNEFVRLKRIVMPFTELAGEGRPDLQVRSISSSEFQVFLDSAPAVAAMIATAVERLIAAYERILNIRLAHKQLAESGVPDDKLEGVSQHVSEGMEEEIRRIAGDVVSESNAVDDDRRNELRTEMTLQLNALARRIDHGYNVEIRTGEIPDVTEGEEDEQGFEPETRDAVRSVLEAQQKLEFMNVSGKPILHLEQPDDHQAGGTDGEK